MNKVFRVGLTEKVNIPWGYLPGERPLFYHLLTFGSQNDFQINEVEPRDEITAILFTPGHLKVNKETK